MRKKTEKDLMLIDSLFEQLKKNARDLAQDFASSVESQKVMPIIFGLVGFLAIADGVLSLVKGNHIYTVFSLIFGGVLLYASWQVWGYYKYLKKKYSKLIKLAQTIKKE